MKTHRRCVALVGSATQVILGRNVPSMSCAGPVVIQEHRDLYPATTESQPRWKRYLGDLQTRPTKRPTSAGIKDMTSVTYMPPRDRQTAKRKQKTRAEEWIKSEDGITETMAGPNGVYTRFVSTSPPESEQDDA